MPPILRYAGFGNEATFGVAVPAAFHADISGASLDAPSDTENYYGGGLGRAIRTRRPGYYRPGGNVVYAWDIRTIVSMLRWTLGGYVFTADTPSLGENTHEAFGVNEAILPSFTTRLGKDVFEHVFAGCVVDSLVLDLAGDFLLATMELGAQKDSKAALQAVDALLLPDEFPLAFHEVTLELPAASDLSASVKALTLTIANGLRPDSGRSIGSRFARRLPVGEREVTLGLDLWYEDTAQLETFWGAVGGPADAGATDFITKIIADAGIDGSLVLDFPSTHFSQVQQQGSGRDEITRSTALRAIEADVPLNDLSIVRSELLATVVNSGPDASL